jgi:hypothetical protein
MTMAVMLVLRRRCHRLRRRAVPVIAVAMIVAGMAVPLVRVVVVIVRVVLRGAGHGRLTRRRS